MKKGIIIGLAAGVVIGLFAPLPPSWVDVLGAWHTNLHNFLSKDSV